MTWPAVEPESLTGRYVTLRRLVPEDAGALVAAADDSVWTYLGYGPWPSAGSYREWIAANAADDDPLFFAVVVDGEARGVVSYLRMDEANGVVEIGHIWYAPSIQRSRATTEATYLLARHVFDDLGYRRLEWKCNALNARSRAAAERFGFTYEGPTRSYHHTYKGVLRHLPGAGQPLPARRDCHLPRGGAVVKRALGHDGLPGVSNDHGRA